MLSRLVALFAGLGPLYESGSPPGGAPAGEGPTPGQPPAGQPPGGGGTPPTPPTTGQPPAPTEQAIPYARFKEVNDQLAAYKKAEEDRAADEAKKKGDYETLSRQEKEKREAADARAIRIGRRAAFVSKAAGKVADPEAAYKLAVADDLLKDVEIDDEGNAKDPAKVEAAVTEVTKRYEFLKPAPGSRSFGEPRGGQGPTEGGPPPKDAHALLRLGYEQSSRGS